MILRYGREMPEVKIQSRNVESRKREKKMWDGGQIFFTRQLTVADAAETKSRLETTE